LSRDKWIKQGNKKELIVPNVPPIREKITIRFGKKIMINKLIIYKRKVDII